MKADWMSRDATVADHPAVISLNNSAAPHVNVLAMEELDWLVGHAAYFRVLEDAAGLAGFVLCLPSGINYWSENYRWFTERYAAFLYLDRVVVAPRAQGSGVGRALYEDLHAFAAGRWERVMLEVNLRPPNPGSDAFHERLGYVVVGTREYDAGERAVRMCERRV